MIFFLKEDRIKFFTNLSLIPQNLSHYRSKVVSKFLHYESHLWDPWDVKS
jgi:hypothetical protein